MKRFRFLVFHQGLLPTRMLSCQHGFSGNRAELEIGEGDELGHTQSVND